MADKVKSIPEGYHSVTPYIFVSGAAGSTMLYVNDVDASFKQATAAGATAKQPPTDMFWGDRAGKVVDPFGHTWMLSTHIEDVAPEEMERRGKEFSEKMAKGEC